MHYLKNIIVKNKNIKLKIYSSYSTNQGKLKTFHFQSSLPRLPIPKLEKTCERYLAALKPLLNDENYKKTVNIVNKFKYSDGLELQKLLEKSNALNKHTSYISEPWFDMYLRDRVPLPINYNPLLVMKHDERKLYNNQLIRGGNIIISALRFMQALRMEYLEPEIFHLNPKKSDTAFFRKVINLTPKAISTYVAYMFKAFPLDMSQYNGLFGSTRIPRIDKDEIYRKENSKHIIIMHRGNFFKVNVVDANGNIENPNIILGRLNYILKKDVVEETNPLGILTTADRNTWAKLRNHLIELGNKDSFEIIDSALFCLCLDDNTYDLNDPKVMIKNNLAGNAENRWFDKSISILLSKDGTTSINFEHSWGDGVAVLRFFNEIYNETIKSPLINPESVPNENDADKNVNLIKFKMDDHMKTSIKNAIMCHNKILDSLDINYLRYEDINRSLCKRSGISPDSIMQLAFQLGYRNISNKYVSTYESCSTAAFKHGRTETIRPCTIETKLFCDSVLKKQKPSFEELKDMINKCSVKHGNLTKEAAMGQGFDRHLFGLKNVGEKHGFKKAEIFKDNSYALINYNILSTSTLSSPGLLAGAFGPVVKDGYGIGYTITNDLCGTLVTSYNPHVNGTHFIESVHFAFNTIKKILN